MRSAHAVCDVRVAIDPGARDAPPRIQRLREDGTPDGRPEALPDLGAVAVLEREHAPRWVLPRPRSYPGGWAIHHFGPSR